MFAQAMAAPFAMGISIQLMDMFSGTARKIEASMGHMNGASEKWVADMERHFQRFYMGLKIMAIGMAVLLGPSLALGATINMQRALAELSTLGVQDLDAMRREALNFSDQWAGMTAPEFVTSAYDIKSALSDLSDQDLPRFTSTMALTAKATKATTDEMTRLFTTASGVFALMRQHLGNQTFAEQLSGATAATVQIFRTTGSSLAQAFENLGASGSARGWSMSEQFAALGLLQGTMTGPEAGTALRSMTAQLPNAAKELGVDFTEANGNALGLLETIKLIDKQTRTMGSGEKTDTLTKAFGSEAIRGVLGLLDGLGKLDEATKSITDSMAKGTELTLQMSRLINRDIGSQLRVLTQQLANLGDTLGTTLLPVVLPVFDTLQAGIATVRRLAEQFPGLTRMIMLSAVVVGVLLVVFGALVTLVGAVGLILGGAATALTALTGAAVTAGGAIGMLFPIAAGIVAILGILIGVAIATRKAWDSNFLGLRETTLRVVDAVGALWEGLKAFFATLRGSTFEISDDLYRRLGDSGLMGLFVLIVRTLYRMKVYWTAVWSAMKAETAPTIDQIMVRLHALEPVVSGLVQALGKLANSILSAFGLPQTSAIEAIGRVVGGVLGFVIDYGLRPIIVLLTGLAWVIEHVVTPAVRGLELLLRPLILGLSFLMEHALSPAIRTATTMLEPFRWGLDFVAAAARAVSDELEKMFSLMSAASKIAMMVAMPTGIAAMNGLQAGADYADAYLNGQASPASISPVFADGNAANDGMGTVDLLARGHTDPMASAFARKAGALIPSAEDIRSALSMMSFIFENTSIFQVDGEQVAKSVERRQINDAERRF